MNDNTAQPLTCGNCGEVSTNPGQFTPDGQWVCTEACRTELYVSLAANGGNPQDEDMAKCRDCDGTGLEGTVGVTRCGSCGGRGEIPDEPTDVPPLGPTPSEAYVNALTRVIDRITERWKELSNYPAVQGELEDLTEEFMGWAKVEIAQRLINEIGSERSQS